MRQWEIQSKIPEEVGKELEEMEGSEVLLEKEP